MRAGSACTASLVLTEGVRRLLAEPSPYGKAERDACR